METAFRNIEITCINSIIPELGTPVIYDTNRIRDFNARFPRRIVLYPHPSPAGIRRSYVNNFRDVGQRTYNVGLSTSEGRQNLRRHDVEMTS